MKITKLAKAIGQIEDGLISEAAEHPPKSIWLPWGAIVACFLVLAIAGGVIFFPHGDTEYVNSGIVAVEGLEGFSIIENPVYPDYTNATISPTDCWLGFSTLEEFERSSYRAFEPEYTQVTVIARVKRKNSTVYYKELSEIQKFISDDLVARIYASASYFALTEVEILEIYNQDTLIESKKVKVGDTLIIREQNVPDLSEKGSEEESTVYLPAVLPVEPGEHIMYLNLPTKPLFVGEEKIGVTLLPNVWSFQYFPLDPNKRGSVWLDNLHQDVLDKYIYKTYVAPPSKAPIPDYDVDLDKYDRY
ncbi:MAG: hypothetical protein IJY82_03035 [Oscillospiraceae bacterium]|nr:hypothetical protein [Oscillospiraceae bacterium]